MGSHRRSGSGREQSHHELPASQDGPPPLKNQAGRGSNLQGRSAERSARRTPQEDAGEIERNAIGDRIIKKGQEKMAKPQDPEPTICEGEEDNYNPNLLTVCVQRLGNGYVAYPTPDGRSANLAAAAGATNLTDAQRALQDIIQDWEDDFQRRKREAEEEANRQKQRQYIQEHENVESFEDHVGRSDTRGQWLPRMFQRKAG